MVAVNGQIAVTAGTGTVNICCCSVGHGRSCRTIDDTAVVGGIGIGLTVEGHVHIVIEALDAADRGGAVNSEAVVQGMSAVNGQIAVLAGTGTVNICCCSVDHGRFGLSRSIITQSSGIIF